MKRASSPTMDELELPASPRKKLKLEEPLFHTDNVHVTAEAPAIPEATPRHHTASENHQLCKPTTMEDAELPTSSLAHTTASEVSAPPDDVPDSNMKDSHHHSDARSTLVNEKAADALQAQPHNTSAADARDESYSKEATYGITEFVSPDLLGFSGILKKRYVYLFVHIETLSNLDRYTDFLVNEILPSGEVVHLDNLKAHPKSHKNKEHFRNSGQASSTNKTEDKADASPITTQQHDEKPGTAVEIQSGDDERTHPHPDTSTPRYPTLPPKEKTSTIEVPQAIPESMQGFNKYEQAPATDHKEEKISPHKRLPPPAPSIPLSMQDLDGKQPEQKQEKTTRRKEKVHIRQTSQGWVEFDKEKEEAMKKEEDETKKDKAGGDAAAGVQSRDDTEIADIKPEKVPEASTQASWQAFASNALSSTCQVSVSRSELEILLTLMQLQPEDKTTLLSYFSSDIVDEILALYDRILDSPHRKPKDYGTVTSGIIDRQKRTFIHKDIRRIFDSRLETMTDNDGAMIITAMAEKSAFNARNPSNNHARNNERGDHRGNNRRNDRVKERGNDQGKDPSNGDGSKKQAFGGARGKNRWEDLGGKYLHFSLHKENKDTMEVISWLSKSIRMAPRSFQFAGTKDRRAVTVQRVSVERVLVNALISAGRTLRNAHVGNFEYRPHSLQLGELAGNEFVITLRDCDFHYPVPLESKLILEGARAIVGEAMENLRDRGFINYYGLQRFGTFSIGTETVGLKMLQGDFRGAVDAILDYSPASLAAAQSPVTVNTDKVSMDDRARAHALHTYRTTNRPADALYDLPRRFSAESSIIRHLTGRSDHREDYLGALKTISRNLRLMYVHAYQSLIWNSAASERWRRFGASVVEGDLVLINDHTDKAQGVTKNDDVDSDGEAIVLPGVDDRAIDLDDIFERARALTREEAESGKYDIFDIVLPTPGYDILYPQNEIGKFYKEFMASERGGGLDLHNMRREWKDISLSGSYRKILGRPGKDFSFEIKAYKDEDEQFVMTDMDRLNKGSRKQKSESSRYGQENHHTDQKNITTASSAETQQVSDQPAQGHDASETMKSTITNAVPNGNDNDNRTKTPSQESEDMELGGVSLIGGAYRDYKIAIILKLQLGTSQYATMALRELMKEGGLRTWKADFSGGR